MRMKDTLEKFLFLFMWVLCDGLSVVAQDYMITIPSEKGTLIDSYVHCIYKDSDGFVWLGTGTSLERWDGRKSNAFLFDGASTNYAPYLVNAILEVKHHDYWVGNALGIWRLDLQARLVRQNFADLINFPVYALEKDTNDIVYVGTSNGLYAYQEEELCKVSFDAKNAPEEMSVLAINVTDAGKIWLLTPGGLSVYDRFSGSIKSYANTLSECGRLNCMIRVDDKLYIGTEKGRIIRFDLNHYLFQSYYDELSTSVTGLSYEDGLLAVGSKGQGIRVLSLADGKQIYKAGYAITDREGLLSDNISSILLSDGNIWCGTDFYLGFNLLRNVGGPFRLYSVKGFTSRNLTVRSCYHTGRYMFIGTREGFYAVDEWSGKNRFFSVAEHDGKLRSNLIFSFYEHQGLLYIGTCGGGISVWDIHAGRMIENELTRKLVSNDIFMFMEDGKGNLWLATSDGLYGYNYTTRQITEYNAVNSRMPGNIVYCIHLDAAGRFWVGTDKGTTLFDVKTGQCSHEMFPTEFICNEKTRYISEGRDGSLHFFFMEKNRLYAVNDSLLQGRMFTDLNCFNEKQDEAGNYWIGCEDGIIKADEGLNNFTLYPLDGLVDVMTGSSPGSAIMRSESGDLLIPATKGLVVLDTQAPFYSSPLKITDVWVNGEQYVGDYNIRPDSSLVLEGGANNLTFRFASLGYENPDLLRYQYRLEGKDTVWHWMTGDNKVSYFNLGAGEYVFRVRKALDGESESKMMFSIVGDTLWSWMIGLAMIVVAGGVFILVVRAKKKKEGIAVVEVNPVVGIGQVEKAQEGFVSESYAKLTDEEAQKVIDALKKFMEKKKPYLKVDLRQSEVAAAIGSSAYILSAVFTHYLKMGYYDFINTYRVDAFKKAVDEGEHQKYTLVTLAEKCGFKSKTSFFRTFKKLTGFTPNEYIQRMGKG